MIFVAMSEAADRGELLLVSGGMCRFHLRRDGVVVIREILVLPYLRGTGIGKQLMGMVRDRHPTATFRAVCPQSYEANKFWKKLGFTKVGTKGTAFVWEFPT